MWISRLVLAAAMLAAPAAAQAQELTRLYAPRPPAGSAYVRVIDLSQPAAQLRLGNAPAAIAPNEVATIYRVVKGDVPVDISLNGKALDDAPIPPADAFSTIVIAPDGSARLIGDGTDTRNDLKAQLRVYNLVSGCDGTVSVLDGPAVFEGVGTNETRSRAINPIEARLAGTCGGKVTEPFQLPPLKAGDHFSVFLLEGPSGPVLRGQRDETEPYGGGHD